MNRQKQGPSRGGRSRTCPTCGARAEEGSEWAPFCCERCRLVDLGRWFDGRYVVSRDATPEDYEREPRRTDD